MSWTSRSENRFTGCVAQRGDRRVARRERRRVAERAAGRGEQAPAARDRRGSAGRVGDGVGGARKRMKNANCSIVAHRLDRRRRVDVGDVVGHGGELAARRLVALGLKQLVGDPHLDVVGLAGEQQQRFVLRLPAEARDRAVVAVVVGLAGDRAARDLEVRPPADAERAAWSPRCSRWLATIGAVGNLLDQAGAERRRRNAEDDVVVGELAIAKSGCASEQPLAPIRPVIGEQRVHAAVRRAVGVLHEARLANRPVRP